MPLTFMDSANVSVELVEPVGVVSAEAIHVLLAVCGVLSPLLVPVAPLLVTRPSVVHLVG
jgi:hypothetical protein